MKNYLILPVAFFLSVIVIAHFFSPPGYRWTQNSISELGSQGHPNAWIMRAGFIGFGILLTLCIVLTWKAKSAVNVGDIFIIIYGLSILFTGIYSAAPIDPAIPFSAHEAALHSIFATITGISFSIAIAWRLFSPLPPRERILHLVFLVLITVFSLSFGLAENGSLPIGKGIVQRLIFLSGFIWLILIGYR